MKPRFSQSTSNRTCVFVLLITVFQANFRFQELLCDSASKILFHETLVNAVIWVKASQGKRSLGNTELKLNSYQFLGLYENL